jgi:hypothetical protein
MTDSIKSEDAISWLQRARANAGSLASATDASTSAARALAAGTGDGWDPWEVWLRHIDQPRRRARALRTRFAD